MNRNTNASSRKLLMERSVPGRRGTTLPACDVPLAPLPDKKLLRQDLALPEVSEPEIIRYFTYLSTLNFGVDSGFYPLGSCTMKYNPKLHEEVALLSGFTQVHPLQPVETAQGALQTLHRLQSYLAEVSGMEGASLAPSAGAHGEFSGMLMIRAYHHKRGDSRRAKVLIPDSAHGTNPASAAMTGFDVVTIPSDKQGNIDLKGLEAALSPEVAGIMLTMPSTLGLFDPNTVEICRLVHKAGGLVYGDGANFNALLGQVKLGDLGFDVIHINVHKTFSTPHGGGGPGGGPVCAGRTLVSFLPAPVIRETMTESKEKRYELWAPPDSIGKISGFHGNFGVLLRAYAYIRLLGAAGLKQVSDNAVINANYILAKLKDDYDLPYQRSCMHEVVLSATRQRKNGVKALDVAKRLIDYGYHPPTMYFPLVVEEALMIEPTETESKEALDAFIEVMKTIAREAVEDTQLLKDAPHDTPNTRLDEARAARKPDLRWQPGS